MLQRIVIVYGCLGATLGWAVDVYSYLRAVQALQPHQQVQLAETGLRIAQMDAKKLAGLKSNLLFQGDRLHEGAVVSVEKWEAFLVQTLAVILEHPQKPAYQDYYAEAFRQQNSVNFRYREFPVNEEPPRWVQLSVASGALALVGGFFSHVLNLDCGKQVCPQVGYGMPSYLCVMSLTDAQLPESLPKQDLYKVPFCQPLQDLSQVIWKDAYAGGAFCKERASCILNNTQAQYCLQRVAQVGEQVVQSVPGHCLKSWQRLLSWQLPLGLAVGALGYGLVQEHHEKVGVGMQAGRSFMQDRVLVQWARWTGSGVSGLRYLSRAWTAALGGQQRSHLAQLATESFTGLRLDAFDLKGFEEEV
ncbi:MAG: hypothetical protein OXT67_04730 [Zetaproteobacteria bacterium]|nr:hypothetical protein [Zetaproteobacteria bacterium]